MDQSSNRPFNREPCISQREEFQKYARAYFPPPPPSPLLSVSYRKVRRPKRSWLGSLSYAVFIRGGRSVPPSIKPVDSGGRWQSDAGRRCERICRGPPHFRFEPRFEQPRGSSDRSWTICEFYVHALPFDRSLQVKRWIFRVKSFVTFSFFLFIYIRMYTFFLNDSKNVHLLLNVVYLKWIFNNQLSRVMEELQVAKKKINKIEVGEVKLHMWYCIFNEFFLI